MRKLQIVQSAAARLLSGVRKYQHISPTMAALHWLPIHFRIDFKVLMMTYKALNGLGPRYLADRCKQPLISKEICGGAGDWDESEIQTNL